MNDVGFSATSVILTAIPALMFAGISLAEAQDGLPRQRHEVRAWAKKFDEGNHFTEHDLSQRRQACRPIHKNPAKKVVNPRLCNYFKRRKYFSESHQFQALIHFKKSPAEAFAKYLERFLFEKTFACERPALNAYFAKILGVKEKICADLMTTVASRNLWIDIDPSRVYQIHYLFAGKGESMMSRWGHAMIRLVMCEKGVEPSDACLADVTNDVVVSFRANVEDLILSQIKGLFGGYSSQLFILSFEDVRREYNKYELREMTSVPLRLNEFQKRLLVYKVLESYWSYRGKYYFLGNNCATETLHLLQAVFDDKEFAPLRHLVDPVSPLGIDRALRNSNLAEYNMVDDPEISQRRGYYFPSDRSRLETSFKALTAVSEDFAEKYKNLVHFIEKSSATDRRRWSDSLLSEVPAQRKIILLSALLNFEYHFAYRMEIQYRKKVFEILAQMMNEFSDRIEEFRAQAMANYESALGHFDFGIDGIPQPNQVEEARRELEDQITSEEDLASIQQEVQIFLEDKASDLVAEMRFINENVKYYMTRMRER